MRLARLTILLFITSCQTVPSHDHTSANSLDWTGRYHGTLPCADCEGIETTLDLSADRTFELTTRYLGKSTRLSATKGSFEWRQNGGVIELTVGAGPRFYRVEENRLRQLDTRGERIEGALADKYLLIKADGR